MLTKGLVFLIGFWTFQVQLMETKALLPQFGGSAAVWLGSLLFFQAALLVAYFLNFYILNTKEKLAFFTLISWSSFFLLQGALSNGDPLINLLLSLASSMGILYVLLLNFNPYLQKINKNPYETYAYSNLGAFAGLLSYPLIWEPLLSITVQKNIWLIGAGLITLLSLFLIFENKKEETMDNPKNYFSIEVLKYSFLGNLLLGAFSYYLTQDLVSFPFLWMLPLLLFLLSYVLVFKGWSLPIKNGLMEVWLLVIISGVLFGLNLYFLIAFHCLFFFLVSLKIQEQVFKLKPDPSLLSFFYLLLAVGGLASAIVFNFVFPLVLKNQMDLVLTIFLILLVFSVNFKSRVSLLVIGLIILSIEMYKDKYVVAQGRNFYGQVKVIKKDNLLVMYHGNIVHGEEASGDITPRGYYGKETLVGKTFREMQLKKPSLKVAVIGMGAGVMSSYLRSDDYLDFYELNPLVVDYAHQHFSFLRKSLGHIEIFIGDGRLELLKRNFNAYDLIIIDAFNGDSIPLHLLTKEAMDLYRIKTSSDGTILFHISNNYVNLFPQIKKQAQNQGFYNFEEKNLSFGVVSHWVRVNKFPSTEIPKDIKGLWTDDYSSIWPYLK